MQKISQALLLALLIATIPVRADDTSAPPPEGELIAVGETELFVRRMGSGEPLLIVHGGPVLDHGYFLPAFEALAESHELIFYDQRLSGRSAPEAPPESLRLATFADDIEALRTTLGLGKIHLYGHSWGGLIAMRYAIDHGENLRSLILSNSIAPTSVLWQEEQKLAAAMISDEHRQKAAEIRAAEDFAARRPEAIQRFLLHSFRAQFHDPARADALNLYVPDDYIERSGRFGAMMVDLKEFDFTTSLAKLDVPTLVLYGASEPGGELGGKALEKAIPGVVRKDIADAGHFPFIEKPDAYFAVVKAFLGSL